MMKKLLPALSLLIALGAQTQALAQVTVSQPWVRATVAQQKATGAFFQLKSVGDSRLVEVRSAVAGVAEIHEMSMEGGVMRMRPLADGLALPAGQSVELKPGGYHVMLLALKKPIAAGDAVPLTLVFEGRDKKRETVEVQAEARALGSAAPASEHKH